VLYRLSYRGLSFGNTPGKRQGSRLPIRCRRVNHYRQLSRTNAVGYCIDQEARRRVPSLGARLWRGGPWWNGKGGVLVSPSSRRRR